MFFDAFARILDAFKPQFITKCNRILLGLVVALTATSSIGGSAAKAEDEYLLTANAVAGSLAKVDVELEVKGELLLNNGSKQPKRVPLIAKGKLAYDELRLASSEPVAGLRMYRQAEADILVSGNAARPLLDPAHRIIAIDRRGERPILFSPSGPLTREQLDLIDVQCNSLLLNSLLPPAAVKVGDRWPTEPKLLAPVLSLDTIHQSDVVSTLATVDEQIAVVEMVGRVSGSANGVPSDIDVSASYAFDLSQRSISTFAVSLEEQRAIGQATPGFNVRARVRVNFGPLDSSRQLQNEQLAAQARQAAESHKSLMLDSPPGGFRFVHDRNWHVLGLRDKLAVLRLVREGDVVAQCNVHRLTELEDGKQPSIDDFKKEVQKSLDKNFGRFVAQSQHTTSAGLQLLRVVAEGKVEEIPIRWIYYHVSDEQRRQATCVFTLDEKYTAQLAESDWEIVSSFQLSDRQLAPTESARRNGKSTR